MPFQENNPRYVSRITKETYVLVLAGGKGSRLHELTDWRAKPALYFGGKFRIIDFPLSNCINSGLRKIGVLTQYKAHSLVRHLIRAWGHFKNELGEHVEILPASQRYSANWYLGTADAVYQNIDIIRSENPKYVMVLSGDHIYQMDYGPMLAEHEQRGADMSISCLEVPVEEAANSFGVVVVDNDYNVTGFEEKPAEPSPIPDDKNLTLASMGNYIFKTDFLFDLLEKDAADPDSTHDFGNDIIPKIVKNHKVCAIPFRNTETKETAYWRDVGTLDSFWEANMELIAVEPAMDLYSRDWPIWTLQAQLPPAKFVHDTDERRGMAVNSTISGGCIISGARITESLLFSNVRVEEHSVVEKSVVLPSVKIGKNCKIRKAIIDRSCEIPAGMNIGIDLEQDKANGFRITEKGVVLVTRKMLGQREDLSTGRTAN